MCSKESVSIKTERDVEMQLGIKTEPQPCTSGVTDSLSNNWLKEKEGLVQQIVDSKTEHQRAVLVLKQLESKFSSQSLEKEKLNEEISVKETMLLKQKEEDGKTIATLSRENKALLAQLKQLQAGISHQKSFENNKKKSTNKHDAVDDNVYEIEAIIDHKGAKTNRQYLVRWTGFSADDDTWESESNFYPEILKTYKKNKNIN